MGHALNDQRIQDWKSPAIYSFAYKCMFSENTQHCILESGRSLRHISVRSKIYQFKDMDHQYGAHLYGMGMLGCCLHPVASGPGS